jgi:hypothetical protein
VSNGPDFGVTDLCQISAAVISGTDQRLPNPDLMAIQHPG